MGGRARNPLPNTPLLDELETGPWSSFVSGLKRLAGDNPMMGDLLGQLERSYEDRKGYWKGGKSVLKIGASMGTVINPFMKPESDEDFEKLRDLSRTVLDSFAENALEHERTGERIERIGRGNFLEGIGIAIGPDMIASPRSNPYVRMDGWDEEAAKWFEQKQAAA